MKFLIRFLCFLVFGIANQFISSSDLAYSLALYLRPSNPDALVLLTGAISGIFSVSLLAFTFWCSNKLCKKCEKENSDDVPTSQTFTSTKQRPPHKLKAIDFKIYIIALFCIVIICLCVIIFIQHQQINDLDATISNQNTTIAEMESTITAKERRIKEIEARLSDYGKSYTELQEEKIHLEIVLDKIAYVPDDGTRIYHKHDCEVFIASGSSYWAYNTESAQAKGYKPCASCCND